MAIMLYENDFYVHTSMIDTKDRIRPAAILDFFQDCASVNAKELGVGFPDLLKLNLYWVIMYEEFEILSDNIPFGTKVLARTWPKSRTRLEFEREYELLNLEGERIAKGISTWCVINTKTRKLERGDAVIFKGEYYEYTNYPEKTQRKLRLPDIEPLMEFDYQVQYTDLDHNMHMNNAKYLDVIYNMHATEKRTRKCRIGFVNEAHFGETIHVSYYQNEGLDYYCGTVDGKQCFIAEIVTEE